jgi:antirestriction protein
VPEQLPVQGLEPAEQVTTHEVEPELRPRIYVASLSDYNAGRLHGRWLDADQYPSDLRADVQAMLADSREPVAEDWAIHDHENFGGIHLSEHEPLETISSLAAALVRHGPAFAAFASWVGLEQANGESFEEQYRGEWPDLATYSDELLRDHGAEQVLEQIPAWLQHYIQLNVDAFVRDLQLGGDIYVTDSETGIFVFDANG